MANLLALVRRVDTLGARSSISCGSKLAFVRPRARPQIQRNPRLGTVALAAVVAPCNLLNFFVRITSARRNQTAVRSVSRERDTVQPAELLHAEVQLNPIPTGAPTPHPTGNGALAAENTPEWQELRSNPETELFGARARSASDAATAEVAANGIPSRREVLLKELGHLPFDRCRHYIASKLPPSPGHDLLEVAGGFVIIFVYFMVLVFPWLVSMLPFVTWGYHQIQAIITVFWGAALVYQWRCESVRWNKLRRLRAIERNSIGST